MSMPLPLQQRVMDVLTKEGPVRARDLPHWIPGVDMGALDCAMSALMRANKASLSMGSYEVVKPPELRPLDQLKKAAASVSASKGVKDMDVKLLEQVPPSAAEEGAANPAPTFDPVEPAEKICVTCGKSYPIETHFQLVSSRRVRARVCRFCHGKRSSEGIARQKANGLKGEPVIAATSTSASGSHANESPPTYTPPPSQGSTEPPPVSSQHTPEPRLHGMQAARVCPEDREALPAVGAALDPMSSLVLKRASLIDRREQLLRDYEKNLKGVIDRIEEIDHVMQQVWKLAEEVA